jgi:Ubiquitin-conjugating enzyme
MTTGQLRRDADAERVRALAAQAGGRIQVLQWPAPGQPRFLLDLHYATAGSARYPAQRQPFSRLAIELAPRHPFMPPTATVMTPIFHPHVFASGLVCQGARWLASEGMDLFVIRMVRLLAFDPLLVNSHSVAHREAMQWYAATSRRLPEAFPTDAAALALGADAPSAQAAPAETRVLRTCPGCGAGLRLPVGRQGGVACPRCGCDFEAST